MKSNKDEFGVEWIVMAHDPAAQHINKLHRLGLDIIVLPRYTYMNGLLDKVPNLAVVGDTIDYTTEVRMFDCLELLK